MAAYDVDLDPARAGRIVDELTAIRERGLEELDVPTGTEKRKEVPEVEALANAYCAAAGIPVYGRAAGIRAVLRAALVAYARWGNDSESQVLAMLFFDLPSTKQSQPRPQRRRPRERLAAARARTQLDDKRFYEYQHGLFAGFAPFLVGFVAATVREAEAQQASPDADETDEAASSSSTRPRHSSLIRLVLAACERYSNIGRSML